MNKGQESSFSADGFRLAKFGKGRNAIQSSAANELVRALNPLGKLKIEQPATGTAKVIYSDGNVILSIPTSANTVASTWLHPFKVSRGSTWLKVTVSRGRVANLATSYAADVAGGATEYTLTSGAVNWVIVQDLGTSAPSIGVTTAPTWSTDIHPIASVDCTDAAHEVALIDQFYHDNIYLPC